jgi:outer membrane protein assembly factor BamD
MNKPTPTSNLPGGAALLALLCAVSLVIAACGGQRAGRVPEGTTDADKFLFERGNEELNEKHWITSREFFRQLVDNYPQSPFRGDAKLGIGDSFLGEGTTESYVQAISEFREFLTFFPTHPRADYAQYKIGLVHHAQMRGPERDQTETREAVREFETFVEKYPNSTLMAEVQTKLRESRDRLGESEYRVGLFYYRARWYPGAIDRFKELLEKDPEYSSRDAVYFHLAESLARTDKKAEALPYFERLLKEFEVSEYLEEAQKRVAELKTDMPQTAR